MTALLPPFAKSIGLDLIIRPDGKVLLIELQNNFGRLGLMRLFPKASRRHREMSRRLRRKHGPSQAVYESLRRACSNKISTYRLLRRYQPSSFIYQGWSTAAEAWLKGLECDFLLAKPPRGSCGRGIRVMRRADFQSSSIPLSATGPILLQEYVESRALIDRRQRPHMGCLRHIVHLTSDTRSLGFVHLPPYWRISPVPFEAKAGREAFIANITTGARPEPVDADEIPLVWKTAEAVGAELMGKILGLSEIPRGRSVFVGQEGELHS